MNSNYLELQGSLFDDPDQGLIGEEKSDTDADTKKKNSTAEEEETTLDKNTTGWVYTEIAQIAHAMPSLQEAQWWLLKRNFTYPEEWDSKEYHEETGEWRQEFISHIFDVLTRRQHMITLLSEVEFDVEVLVPAIAQNDIDEDALIDRLEVEEKREKRAIIEDRERKKRTVFVNYVEDALKNTKEHFATAASAEKWMYENDVILPAWWYTQKRDRRKMKGFLRNLMLQSGKLIVSKQWDDTREVDSNQSYVGHEGVELESNPQKDIWANVINRTVKQFANKAEAEQWFIDLDLSLPEHWNKKRTQWRTQFKYGMYLYLHRGIVIVRANESGRTLITSSSYKKALEQSI